MLQEIIAGDTLDFDTAVTDVDGNQYTPAGGWSMTLMLVPRVAGTAISIVATTATDGESFRVAASASSTAVWTAGYYTSSAMVAKADERKTVALGEVRILADPAVATSYDNRSHAKRVLDAIEAVLETRATVDQKKVVIGGRELERFPVADLLKLRQTYRFEVAAETNAERVAAGLAPRNRIYVRM